MDKKPESIWKRSWMGPRGLFLWFISLLAAAFLIIFSIGYCSAITHPLGKLIFFAFLYAIGWALVGTLLVAFIHWLCNWRNFKRFLFGLACFVTLVALFYAEENWRGKHDWEKYKREWGAKGEKFDFADFVPPPVPDDQNFALTPIVATCYESILDKNGHKLEKWNTNVVNRLAMSREGDASDWKNWPTNGNWLRQTITDLRGWQHFYSELAAKTNEFPVPAQPQSPAADVLLALSKYDAVIEELRTASQLPCSRFPLNYNNQNPAEILLPHLAALKQCSLALQLRAIAELQSGQSEQAFDDVKLIFRLTDSIHTEPFIISQLVRFAIAQIAMQPIWEGLAEHKWSDTQLAGLDAELSKLDFPADYEFSVRGERASRNKIIDWIEQKRSRYWLLADMTDNNNQPNVVKNFLEIAVFYLVPKGWFYENEITIAQAEQQWNLSMVDATNQTVSPKKVQNTASTFESSLRHLTPFNFFARWLLPALGNFAQKTAYAQNMVNMARVAIALERYRLAHEKFPESLAALTPQFMGKIPHDIINGRPLHYRRTDDGQFVLYSVGWNETDDGGIVGQTANGKNADNHKGDWVWQYPLK